MQFRFPGKLAGLALVLVLAAPLAAQAGALTVTVIDKNGAPMSNVVVTAMPLRGTAPKANPLEPVTIAQEDLQFTPYVTVIRTGTAVRFPNYDKIEHHVKSFSQAKEFEYKIYDKGTPPPVVFDKPGLVIVYCMLHGWMRAYISVVDTPYFAKTSSTGIVLIEGLPDGAYEVRAWHPDFGSIKPPLQQTVTSSSGVPLNVSFRFDIVPRKLKEPK